MKTSDMFPGNYLKACDISPQGQSMTMSKLLPEQLHGENSSKYVLYFEGESRGLVLNKTNARRIESLHGDTDDWKGNSIMLRREKVDFKGDYVDAIRVIELLESMPSGGV